MKAVAVLSLICALIVPLVYHMAASRPGGGHPPDMACDACHLAKEITRDNAGMLVAAQEQLCKGCHANAVVASHPSGVPPRMPIPEQFPLDWKGDMTCSTCHSIHSSKPGLPRVRASGKRLCLACHEQDFFARMKDGGISIMVSGHLDARAPLVGEIDAFSIHCMSCHDERGGDLAVSMSGNLIRHNSGRGNHPVGVPYQRGLTFGGYRPVNLLPAAVALPNGKVSCISCHESYSDRHGKLVMDNTGSRLCYTCHDL